MSITFNADEIFEIAEQIERNGMEFYRRAAEVSSDAEARKLMLELADWEGTHVKVFADLRKDLSLHEKEPVFFDPNNEAVMYLRAIAGEHVFSPKADSRKFLSGKESLEQILSKAICFEKDSIAFYVGMRDLVSKELGKEKVDKIIEEEKRHVVMLNKQIASRSS